ncbi:MAG TPA: AraC family transcriptional regulator [Planctomycetota bacterium]|nr:AraC family transcriptional regulator [Planctomycetota bacterium]
MTANVEMELWSTAFDVVRPLDSLPRPQRAATSVQTSPSYRLEGRRRRAEKHCIFVHVLGGCMEIWRSGRTWRVPAGQGFLNIINEPGSGYGYPADAREPLYLFWFGFIGGPSREIVREMLDRHGPVYTLSPERDPLRRLLALRRPEGESCRMGAYSGARLVVDVLAALGESAESQCGEPREHPLVERLGARLGADPAGSWSVKELARGLGASREHLSRVFRAERGQPLAAHLRKQKLASACRMLKETDLTVKQIAARLGYDRPDNFARMFRSGLGMTPGEYRRSGPAAFGP